MGPVLLLVFGFLLGVAVTITIKVENIRIEDIDERIAKARLKTTETKLRQLKMIVEEYKIKNKRIPQVLNELLEPDPRLFDKPWVESEENLLDAWDNPMEIRELERGSFEITSYGADRAEGGENFDADLSSNRLSQPPR